MNNKAFYIGFIVLFSIAAIFTVSVFMNKIRIGKNTNYINIKFDNVNGLRSDDEVRIRGVKCGRVDGIKLYSDFVLVKLQLNNNVKLSNSAYAGIHDYAVIGGTKYIMIYPVIGEPYNYKSDTLMGESYDFSIASMSILLKDMKDILIETIPSGESIQAIVDSLSRTITGINELIDVSGENVVNIAENLNQAGWSVNALLDTLSVSANIIKEELEIYRNENNSIKSLSTSDSMYIKLMNSIEELDKLIKDMSSNKLLKGCM